MKVYSRGLNKNGDLDFLIQGDLSYGSALQSNELATFIAKDNSTFIQFLHPIIKICGDIIMICGFVAQNTNKEEDVYKKSTQSFFTEIPELLNHLPIK